MEQFLHICQFTGTQVLQDVSICDQYHFMKVISSLLNGGTKKCPRYSVHFDDGITIIVIMKDDQFVFDGMLSTGLDSYYLKKGKWPAGKNLEKRIELASMFISKNIKNNRYRKKLTDEPEE